MPQENHSSAGGSGQEVQDFGLYCEGDIEPRLHKKITDLIDSSGAYIVYLDDEYFVEWATTASYGGFPDQFGEIASGVAHLETLSTALLPPKRRRPFGRLLAEAMARILGDRDIAKARETVETARNYLQARALERARSWYLITASAIVVLALAAALAIWVFKARLVRFAGSDAYEVALGGLVGSLGAFISLLTRLGKPNGIKVDAGAGVGIHLLESCARMTAGMAGGLLASLAVKANLLLGLTKSSEHHLAFLLVISVVSGASERFVPSLIERVETFASGTTQG